MAPEAVPTPPVPKTTSSGKGGREIAVFCLSAAVRSKLKFTPPDVFFSWIRSSEARKHQGSVEASIRLTLIARFQYHILATRYLAPRVSGDGRGRQGQYDQAFHVGSESAGLPGVLFKQPSSEELDHDFLWRYVKCLPERGRIGIFNRSYYEEVLLVRVHPEILARQKLPEHHVGERIWG